MASTMSSVHDEDKDDAPPPVSVPASRSGVLVQNVYCEYQAVTSGADNHEFAVMVHLKAPGLVTAAPLDLVAVLDVSSSMAGAKLAHVKRAMAFVIDRLGPRDRLSVVVLSGDARQVIPLTRMTDAAKAAAKLAVDALETSMTTTTSTNFRAALDMAANVLRGSKWRYHAASVILVSDGHDSSVVPNSDWTMPVHTFGLASDDLDAAAMYNISEATGGTFSFVEDHALIQDALAQCIAGLRSVTAHDVYLQIRLISFMSIYAVNVAAVQSGRYKTLFERPCEEADVDVGELYADEERRILFLLDIERHDDDEDCRSNSFIIYVDCSYTDVSSGQNMKLPEWKEYIEIRPVKTTDEERCVEVERELLRVAAAEDMAVAREAAERGAYDEAARILDARRESLSLSAPAMAGDAMCTAVAAELFELSKRVSDEREYKKIGRACILASMSSHSLQRGSSSLLRFGCVGSSSVFASPAMRKMEKLSEIMRKKQEMLPRPPLPANGSKTAGVPLGSRRRLEARLASAVPRLSMLGKYRRLLLKR